MTKPTGRPRGRPRKDWKPETRGRPPAFKSPQDLNEKISEAFNYCDKHKIPYSLPEIIAYLGIHEDTWKNYKEKKSEYFAVIKRAESRIVARVTRLLMKHAPGQIFYMKNKHDWKDKQELTLPTRDRELTEEETRAVRNIAQQTAAKYVREQRNGIKLVKGSSK